MNSVPIHGQRYHCHQTGQLISTDEEMVEHGKFFLGSMGKMKNLVTKRGLGSAQLFQTLAVLQ